MQECAEKAYVPSSSTQDNSNLNRAPEMVKKTLKLPANPLEKIVMEDEDHRRRITGILESYNSSYDILAESVQNALDAVVSLQRIRSTKPGIGKLLSSFSALYLRRRD